jgi:hypothetical protein
MFLWMMIALAVLLVPLTGGRLGNLARVRLRAVWAVVVAVTIQLLVITVFPNGDTMLHAASHLLSYAIGAVFLVANRRLAGIWLAAIGATLNALVIGVNGGSCLRVPTRCDGRGSSSTRPSSRTPGRYRTPS